MSNLNNGLVTLQLKDIDVSSKGALTAILQALLPAIVEGILSAVAGDRARGCSVSGTVSTAGGGSASGTVTCTF